jgi:putative effector of murein hydrolase
MEPSFLITLYSLGITITMYAFSRMLAKEYVLLRATPLFVSTVLIILILALGGVREEGYSQAREILAFLLGPATVALAVPIYKNRQHLYDHAVPVVVGLLMGSVATILVTVAVAKFFQATQVVLLSLGLQSVTVPVALELAHLLKASATLTTGVVIVTGMLGAMVAPWLMNRIGVHHPMSRGLVLGTLAQEQGTVQACAEGELQGAIAGIAMGMAAVFIAFLAPVLLPALI